MVNLVEKKDCSSIINHLDKELKKWMKDCGDEGQATEMDALEHMVH